MVIVRACIINWKIEALFTEDLQNLLQDPVPGCSDLIHWNKGIFAS